jgi:hypothetical protein
MPPSVLDSMPVFLYSTIAVAGIHVHAFDSWNVAIVSFLLL